MDKPHSALRTFAAIACGYWTARGYRGTAWALTAGMVLFDDGGSSEVPIHGSDEVADVTGAGDTVIGTFALALAAGGTPLEAALLANYAGGVVVMKRGTATLSPDELRTAVRRDPELPQAVRWERS